MKRQRLNCCIFVFLSLSAAVFLSCSLNYETVSDTGNTVPELIFKNAQIKTYSNNNLSVRLQAALLEQYKETNIIFAENVSFSTRDDDGNPENEGSCTLISVDQNEEDYTMMGNIKIFNEPNNITIQAGNLHWNGKTEQLTSGRDDNISVSKNNLKMEGSGLSASAVSGNFKFTGKVHGVITEENEDQKGNSTSE